MSPRRKQRLAVIILILMGVSSAIGLVMFSLKENMDFFFTPSEVHQGKKDGGMKPKIGQRIRIGGMVVEGSVSRDPETLKVSFDLIDTGPMVKVIYEGSLPDLFREGQGIIALGVLKDGYVLEAQEVLAKHDENYMPPEVAEAVKGIKHVKPSKQVYIP
ncbi:cytochrome c maturation protein CcmE [Algicola sagamiensis]|uniref:cytochrome c maturation protein CcmE n=1 Tax=Algicola sagamiensis TaxID=163869 RepID=UPI00036FAF49|nr:cytochrome c maturation protein CcmE [Algicola sagamiensis]